VKTVKVLASIAVAIIPLVALWSSGCESEEARQHHLYNLQSCVAQTYAATAESADTFVGSTYVNGQLVRTFKTPDDRKAFDIVTSQSNHDYRAADCMAHEEKTTLEYQLAKHDDYGKVKTIVPPPK
jgi:hypothetical protein